ncbi:MAG: hypothetical protein PVH00_01060, partial [Gemmatimonadota bacterium]
MRRELVHSGHSLVELIVALLLLALLGSTALALLSSGLRLVRRAADATEAGNAVRFAGRLLRSEIETLVASDSHGFDADSSRQRVYRGAGIVCDFTGTTATVRWLGLRAPDPAKDSVLALTPAGETAHPLLAASAASAPACVARPGEAVLELDVSGGLRPGDVVLLYETGTWHLSGSALRYARGAGGRQPLTPAVFVDDSTRIDADTSAADPIAIRLELTAR